MTSVNLLLWIALGGAIQLAIFLGIAFWHHWQAYMHLRQQLASGLLPGGDAGPSPDSAMAAAWEGFRTFTVTRKEIEDQAGAICSFYLAPTDGRPLPAFRPGQFLTFRLSIPTANGEEEIVRCYSLSDAPQAGQYRVSIKRVPSPPGSDFPPGRSSNHFHDRIAVGSALQVRAPAGHFYLDRGDSPVVLLGGGIGITPMLSMVNWCLAEQPEREIWLFYGVRDSREPVMKAHLDQLAASHPNFHLRVCASNPLPDDQAGRDFDYRGRIDVGLLRMELPLKPYHFYLCGPTPMMESLVPALEDWGIPDAHIHFEAFGPASIKRRNATARPGDAVAGTADNIVVTFARSGRQLAWQGGTGSLLELAEANGLKVDSGCRAGGCGSCQTTIRSGEVAYRQVPDFDPTPGSCLLCVCVPKTNVTLEA